MNGLFRGIKRRSKREHCRWSFLLFVDHWPQMKKKKKYPEKLLIKPLLFYSPSQPQLCEERMCQEEVSILAINYMDRVLNKLQISKNNLQLLAATCTFLASKLREPSTHALQPEVLIYYTDNSITKRDLMVSDRFVFFIYHLNGKQKRMKRGGTERRDDWRAMKMFSLNIYIPKPNYPLNNTIAFSWESSHQHKLSLSLVMIIIFLLHHHRCWV